MGSATGLACAAVKNDGGVCKCTRYGSIFADPRLGEKGHFSKMCKAEGATRYSVGKNKDNFKGMEETMNVSEFEGFRSLDDLDAMFVAEELKNLGIGAAAAAGLTAAVAYGMRLVPETSATMGGMVKWADFTSKEKAFEYARAMIPALVGVVGGYFLAQKHGAAGHALAGAGVALSVGPLVSSMIGKHNPNYMFTVGKDTKSVALADLPPRQLVFNAMAPYAPQAYAGIDGRAVPQFAAMDEFSGGPVIELGN